VTGMTSDAASLSPKRIELLREILPGVKRIGRLRDSTDPTTSLTQQASTRLA